MVYRRKAVFRLTRDCRPRHIRLSSYKGPRVKFKSGVTQELRSLAKSNAAADAKNRRRAVVVIVAALVAACAFAVVHWVL